MREHKNLITCIKGYYDKFESGSARDIYYRLGRRFEYHTICDALEMLMQAGYLVRKIVKGTKYIKAHYVYYKVHKKELRLKEFFKMLSNVVFKFFKMPV